ncbi:zinc finger protein 850-like protein [Platysternon megacephalum]|uniref:Zinc finger protein 850-like protein n=1 Tax=Platysternon megacephalum TaxID=55544 RepID=A0A4D9DMJ7_9SAUR|nr:zinc finger protein 850-like protein [Platysternon megacephalum]
MAELQQRAPPAGLGEAKRPEAGEDWCDSGLGSLSEGQLSQIQDGLGAPQEKPPHPPAAVTVTSDPCPGGRPVTSDPSGPKTPDCCGSGSERLDSALGDSLGEDEAGWGAAVGQAVGALAQGVEAVRLGDPAPRAGETPAVAPEAWLRHVLGFVTEDGDTALHLAVIHEHEAFLDSILQYTAGTEYLDLQNDLGQTALHIAVILGASNFVRKLMGAGAGLCVQEKAGHTALHLACREGWRDCAQQLLASLSGHRPGEGNDACAQLDCTNYDGYTPLHVAVLRKDLEVVKLLVGAGADLNKAELSCGRSPLHLAVESQDPEVVECLLRAGADPRARMYVGYTPIYSAVYRPSQKILQLLREFDSEEPDWDSEESLADSSDEEYDDIVINSGHYKN